MKSQHEQQDAIRAHLGEERYASLVRESRRIVEEHAAACQMLIDNRSQPFLVRLKHLERVDREQIAKLKSLFKRYGAPDPDPPPPGW